MNIKEKMANELLEWLEERLDIEIPQEEYLGIEQELGKEIFKSLNHWIKFDVDLGGFGK